MAIYSYYEKRSFKIRVVDDIGLLNIKNIDIKNIK